MIGRQYIIFSMIIIYFYNAKILSQSDWMLASVRIY
jgi:hypothetical protein